MEIGAMLDELREKALKDRNIWQELMDTRKAEQPLAAFCAKCRELGYQIYEMDLITAGEELLPCEGVQTVEVKTLRSLQGKTISMNFFSQALRSTFRQIRKSSSAELEHFSNTLWLKEHRDGDFLWDNVYNGMDYFGYMCIK